MALQTLAVLSNCHLVRMGVKHAKISVMWCFIAWSSLLFALSFASMSLALPWARHIKYGGRVVKALDLRSNGWISAWVRTPPVLISFLGVQILFTPGEVWLRCLVLLFYCHELDRWLMSIDLEVSVFSRSMLFTSQLKAFTYFKSTNITLLFLVWVSVYTLLVHDTSKKPCDNHPVAGWIPTFNTCIASPDCGYICSA